ncbi:MAG TPA: Spy/CpxP family protein refolding chaperone [Xanthobacteraceae bacterium]|nr:Spy/CpxP family protein refolding chaperone [Xanthobacteraceae bacterium]
MLKPVVAMAAVLAIAGSSFVYAQQRSGEPGADGGPRFAQHRRLTVDDMKAFADARIAALKAGLQLTPDQEKNWPSFEQALRDLVKLRIERLQARIREHEAAGEEQPPINPFERLQQRADVMSQFGAALKHVADAGGPLYQSLNDAQKNRFRILAHILRPHRMAGGFWHRGEFGHGDHGGQGGFERRDGGPHGMMGRDDEGSNL